jgi:hypothetical protein
LVFKLAYTQYETSKELLASSQKVEEEAFAKLKEAKIGKFKDRPEATKSFAESSKKFKVFIIYINVIYIIEDCRK